MKAVNLIPADAPGGRPDGVRSDGLVYAVLGVLAVLLVGVTFYVLTGNRITERRDKLAVLQTQATAVQLQAERLHPYVEFASLAQTRVQTVRELGGTRFDWHRALSDLSKVMPDNVWLTSMLGTVTNGVSIQGGSSGSTNGLRSSLPNPAIELTGCTTGHDDVVHLISRMRLIHGVQRVSLADSAKADDSAGGGDSAGGDAGGGAGDDCRHGHSDFPQFDLVVFFEPLPAAPTAPGTIDPSTGTAATAPATAVTPSSTATTTGTTATPSTAAPASSTGGGTQ